ncbi:hypothetical protein SLS58_006587 [Diplodia intermedia]|uniref:holocytochrome-c synthase n=1 Tax=Diplodia intermedia TaxID=856260 RepID=A0ABR3TML8_9PEZI
MASEPAEPAPLRWSAQFAVAAPSKSRHLPGDKLLLPASALEQLLAAAPMVSAQSSSNQPHTVTFDPFNPHTFAAERHARELQYQDRVQQLPHPLTFRLVNPDNGKAAYAGIREFSAEDGEVVLSKFLRESLGVESDGEGDGWPSSGNTSDEDTTMANDAADISVNGNGRARITVHAYQLPKGTFVKLRPLEAGYDPADWKSLLEQHMRTNFTTLTNGEILVIPGGRGVGGKREEFRFLIDGFKPEGDGVCVVDTDLEVDIEALNEEQARETLKKIAAKAQKAPGTTEGSSPGGNLGLLKAEPGQVLDGEYVDYEIPSWIRSQGIEIELSEVDEEDELDLYVSPFGPRQRARPRAEEHVFADVSSTYPKRVRLRPTNVELEDAESLWVSVHAYTPENTSTTKSPKTYRIRAVPFDPQDDAIQSSTASDNAPPNPGDVQCKNCHHCDRTFTSLSQLAHHKTTVCPGKHILCQFCHLEVPQEGDPDEPNPEALLSNLTPHELADGGRTTECHLCNKIIRLRDMATHSKHHEFEKLSRPAPRLCRNVNCGRTLDGASKTGDTRIAFKLGNSQDESSQRRKNLAEMLAAEEDPGCPMHQKGAAPPAPPKPSATPAGACPYVPPEKKDDAHPKSGLLERLNPLNFMPSNLSQERAEHQTVDLPTDREASSIPRGDGGGNWEYPSPQQMYNAMLRKGYTDTPQDAVESMVAVHNFLNEGAWAEILEWERRFSRGIVHGWKTSAQGEEGSQAGELLERWPDKETPPPQLTRFMGRPGELTPKARMMQYLAQVWPSQFNSEPPFDRHDWFVQRNLPNGETVEKRYVIDYYEGEPEHGMPVFYLDVRPAIDTPGQAAERAVRWGRDVWWRAVGGNIREQLQAQQAQEAARR